MTFKTLSPVKADMMLGIYPLGEGEQQQPDAFSLGDSNESSSRISNLYCYLGS